MNNISVELYSAHNIQSDWWGGNISAFQSEDAEVELGSHFLSNLWEPKFQAHWQSVIRSGMHSFLVINECMTIDVKK